MPSTPPVASSSRKNRKINRSAGQLQRNAACVPCRKRRVKCDGTRPICSSCTRSFQFLARTQPDAQRDAQGVQCYYDEEEEVKTPTHDSGSESLPQAIVFPGWPVHLPAPTMVDHLTNTLFNSIPAVSRLIHRPSFMTRLSLPPTHPEFPHPALLHAVCAVAARYSATASVCSVQEVLDRHPSSLDPVEDALNERCFGEKHYKYCKLEMRYDNCQGYKLFELLQAQILVMQYILQTSKWLEGWTMVGTMTRTAIALGLMDDAPGTILPWSKNDHEREERRAAIAEIVAMDAAFSASGNWPGTLPQNEMHFFLPASKLDFFQHYPIPPNPQRIDDGDLFVSHPVEDSFVMYIKGSILLSRVGSFIRRLRRTPNPRARESVEFINVNRDLADFNRTFPASLRDPLMSCPGFTSRIDTDLINAHLIHRVAAILLHEPFADLSNPGCPSAGRLLLEAKSCLGVLYLIMSTTTDMALMLYPIISVWFYHPARTLLLFYHRALEVQDHATAKTLLTEIEVFQMAFAAMGNRFAMGAVHCGMVDTMIKRIHEEFGVPEQGWRWSPQDWQSGALNYQAGMRTHTRLPMLPLTHPDGMAWSEKGRGMSYREIFDQQRAYVGN